MLASCSDARARVAYLELLRRDQQAPLATGTPAYVWEPEAFATVSHLPLVPWELRHPRPRTGWVRIETPGERAWVIGPRGESWGTTPLTRRVEVGLADISLRYDVPGQRTRVVVEEGETTVIRPRPRHRAGCRSAP